MANELALANATSGWLARIGGDMSEAMPVAEMLAKSGLVPKQYQGKPCDIIVASAYGNALGLSPLQSLSAVAVINGRPCIWGDSMLGVCQAHHQWAGMRVQWPSESHCKVTVFRTHGSVVSEYIGEFSEADAKRAGLWTKQGPWSQNPRRMLEIRARAFALRNGFADALTGMYCREEVEDMREVEAEVVDDKPRKGRKPRVVESSSVTIDAAAPAHIIDAVQDTPVAPTAPSVEEQIDASKEDAGLEEFRRVLTSGAKRFGRDKIKAICENACAHVVDTAEDVDERFREAVVTAICALEG